MRPSSISRPASGRASRSSSSSDADALAPPQPACYAESMAAADAPFLQAIADHPDDDRPRLVFADWLDEHGDADRAEYIRAQCDRARLGEDDPRFAALNQREEELMRRHRRDWLGERVPADGIKFCRGFIAKITASLPDYL